MGAALDQHDFVAARMDIRRLNPDWACLERAHPQTECLSVLPHEPYCTHAGGATLGFRREVFDVVGEFDPACWVFEDQDFCIRAHLKGYELRFVPDAVYNYRYRDNPAAIYRQGKSYQRFRALMRRRYAKPVPFLSPRRWLGLFVDIARLELLHVANPLLGRRTDPLSRARLSRRRGRAAGDLAGSLAYHVAPLPRTGGGSFRRGGVPLWRRAVHRAARPFAGSLVGVRTTEKVIALTFDDGPDPASTPALLDLLARHGIRATFFVVGIRAARHPDLVARIAAEGHEIGNHTWDHPALSTIALRQVLRQLRRTRAVLAPHGAALMRPPYGAQKLRTHLLARLLGYRVVTWNINGCDWRADDAGTLARRILAAAAPGAIVLLHDALFSYEEERFRDRRPTIEAVGMLAQELHDYRFVTVSELLRTGSPVERLAVAAPAPEYLDALLVAPAT